ncbi:lipopolysaccharide biosynthesis protein [Vulcanisaeta thermophila]|uniref:lipopolysaccharide biosynthesis protein n=1 Tax=Vulcanisaeta thermophila TaxID=867917 RepID=UPI0008532007|nr:polysaccharide biosynthesis protein [Vulcanisaeta thermophila]
MRRESSLFGVLFNYMPTVVNYALAVVYVVVLTKFIPVQEYGYYNALLAIVNILGFTIPIPGINSAIAREAGIRFARGEAVDQFFAAIVLLSLVMTAVYAIALVLAMPLYLGSGIPGWFLGIVYIYIIAFAFQAVAGALGLYLWFSGRVVTLGVGGTLSTLVLRASQVILIVALRNVYALALSTLLSSLVQFTYYMGSVRSVPNPAKGLGILSTGFRRYLNFGLQSWILGYMGTLTLSLFTYLIYRFLGPKPTAVLGLALVMVNAITAFGGAVGTVLGSRVSQGLGLGVNTRGIMGKYAISSLITASVATQLVILALPVLPRIGIVNGDYVGSIPYASMLMGSAPMAVLTSVLTSYYWVIGNGWYAVTANTLGLAVGLGLYAALGWWGPLALIPAYYAVFTVTALAFWFRERWDPVGLWPSAALVALAMASSLVTVITAHPLTWPLAQVLTLMVSLGILYIKKPLPNILDQVPRVLRPLVRHFVSQ